MLPQPGTYRAQQNGTVIIRQEESGSLMAYIPFLLLNCNEPANYAGIHQLTLGAKDGTPQNRSIINMKAVFPEWDADNLADIEMPGEGVEAPQFDLADCFHDDSYTPEGADAPLIQFKAKWFNQIGGGRKQPMTETERKAAVTKWKAKFKALGTITKPVATTKPVAAAAQPKPATKPAVSGPPGRKTAGGQARTSTQEEVWEAIVGANPDNTEEANGQLYYESIDAVLPGGSEDPSSLTPANWGQVLVNLGL